MNGFVYNSPRAFGGDVGGLGGKDKKTKRQKNKKTKKQKDKKTNKELLGEMVREWEVKWCFKQHFKTFGTILFGSGAVFFSSIGDHVTHSVTHSLSHSLTHLLILEHKERPLRPVTLRHLISYEET